MKIDRKANFRVASGLAGCIAAAVLVAVPQEALATDIAWQTTVVSGTFGGGKFNRVGTAVFKTGEKADMTLEGTDSALDEKGRATVKVDSVLKFKDGSSITHRYTGFRDTKTLEVGGSGEFVSGTGKYKGITGTFTYTGVAGKTESVGTYVLPK